VIWQLTREQLRSQKGFIAWTAGMLIVALALVTYSAVMYATEQANDADIASVTGDFDKFQGYAYSVVGSDDDDAANVGEGLAPIDSVDTAIADAIASGSDVQAARQTYMYLPGQDPSSFGIAAVTGSVDWGQLLVTGTAPLRGELAISSALASDLGVGIGDSVVASSDGSIGGGGTTESDESPMSFIVSGLTASPVSTDGLGINLAQAYASWEDSLSLASAAAVPVGEPSDGVEIFTDMSWNTGSGALDAFDVYGDYSMGAQEAAWLRLDAATALAGALSLGAVVMALAIGRNQAQARATWVGPSRAMGASRRTIAAATVIETLVVGAGASAAGIVLGVGAALLSQSQIRSSVPDAFYPASPVVTWPLIVGLVLLGVILSALIGAIPAAWASRIEPVDALRPAAAIAAERPSRGRLGSAVVYAWLGAIALFLASLAVEAFLGAATMVTTVLGAAVIILTAAMAYRLLRWTLMRLGTRLARSGTPWAVAAGSSMSGRPGQSATVALIFACIVAPMVLITPLLLTSAPNEGSDEAGGLAQALWAAAFVLFLIALAIATIIGVAVHATDAHTSRGDAATRAALGLTRANERKARFWQYWITALVGAGLGAIIGLLTTVVWAIAALVDGSSDLQGVGLSNVVPALIGLAMVIGLTLLMSAGGAAAFSSRLPKGSPAQELARV
jgi:ABC-type lipoprotein release transport system permease subunit